MELQGDAGSKNLPEDRLSPHELGRQISSSFEAAIDAFTSGIILWRETEYVMELERQLDSALAEPPPNRLHALSTVATVYSDACDKLRAELIAKAEGELNDWLDVLDEMQMGFLGINVVLRVDERILNLRRSGVIKICEAALNLPHG